MLVLSNFWLTYASPISTNDVVIASNISVGIRTGINTSVNIGGNNVVRQPQPTQPEVLNEADKREILIRLTELKVLREMVELQKQYIENDKTQDVKKDEIHTRETRLLNEKVLLFEGYNKQLQDQVEFYKKLLDASRKGLGFGCVLKKIFTLGIARCN